MGYNRPALMRKWVALTVLAVLVASTVGCTPTIDLSKAIGVTEVFSGWYDFGVVEGKNKLVPSISFRLQNVGDVPVRRVQVLVSFWPDGADSDLESREVTGIGADDVAPGQSGGPVLVRSSVGYTIEQPRNELFMHSGFKDFTVKLFAKRAGKIVPLGEYKIERRIIPQTSASSRP
jgi:hypothetical protein